MNLQERMYANTEIALDEAWSMLMKAMRLSPAGEKAGIELIRKAYVATEAAMRHYRRIADGATDWHYGIGEAAEGVAKCPYCGRLPFMQTIRGQNRFRMACANPGCAEKPSSGWFPMKAEAEMVR